MKKGQEGIGIVERVDFPNKGIIMIEEEQILVKNALPGQKIRFVVNKVRKGKYEGRLLEVIERSADETRKDYCPHFEDCGGCTYQRYTYDGQLKIKENQVKRLLDAVITQPYEFEKIAESPARSGYRNKMEFSFGDEWKEGPLALGLHKRGSFYDIVTAASCNIVHTDYNMILSAVHTFCRDQNLSYYHKITHKGYLRHLLVRRAEKTGEIVIDFVTSSQWMNCESKDKLSEKNGLFQSEDIKVCLSEEAMLTKLKEMVLALSLEGRIVGILHSSNDSVADIVCGENTQILYGQDYFFEELLGLKFKISIFSFFQTNTLGAEVLYETVRDFVGETKEKLIYDLYSGTGTIAQLLAPVAKKVIGVEIVKEAVLAAEENAVMNGLDNCEFIAGDVLKVIDEINNKPDLIVLDPPRDGIHPKALEKIIDFQVNRIVYISCKPTSLVRDLEVFQKRGYQVERVKCVDMFPWSGHVETAVLLVRKG